MKHQERSTQGGDGPTTRNTTRAHDKPTQKSSKARREAQDNGSQASKAQAMSQHLGRTNDQGRDGKERRTSSPHNR